MLNAYIRARRPDGSECTIDLDELENALDGGEPGEYSFSAKSGKILFLPQDDLDDLEEEELGEESDLEDAEILPLDPISSRERFRWMEDFIRSVHSITAQSALRNALRQNKPFRQFKDALLEYPAVRESWFQFEAGCVKAEAIRLIESLDWEILEVSDPRPVKNISEQVDPAEKLPLTEEEYEWILRGASEIALRGGRTQLALLLKGSKNKNILKHKLDHSPVYGKLSFLTIEEIEHRIDEVIRKKDLRVEFIGDLPLILLNDSAWERVRSWSNQRECLEAAAADNHGLIKMVEEWRQRRREEQFYLLDAVAALDRDSSRRILEAWSSVAGKEVRSRIQAKLDASG